MRQYVSCAFRSHSSKRSALGWLTDCCLHRRCPQRIAEEPTQWRMFAMLRGTWSQTFPLQFLVPFEIGHLKVLVRNFRDHFKSTPKAKHCNCPALTIYWSTLSLNQELLRGTLISPLYLIPTFRKFQVSPAIVVSFNYYI